MNINFVIATITNHITRTYVTLIVSFFLMNRLCQRWFLRIVQALNASDASSRTITSDRTVYNNSSLSFSFLLVGMISLDRNYWLVINLLFVLSGLYLNILKTEKSIAILGQKILDVRGKRLTTCVGNWLRTVTSDQTVVGFRVMESTRS